MPTRPIRIRGCNTTTQELELDYPNRKANSDDKVAWIILPLSGVDSIEEIKGKEGYDNIWYTKPRNENLWEGRIKKGIPKDYEYEYEITWTKGKRTYTHDPKITVNPTGGISFFKLLIGFIASLFLAFLSFRFLKGKK